jgi:predicted DsbA family dithiol-disulfide isomerase
VPYVIVDGKYIVKGKNHEDTLKIARQLVDKARGEESSEAVKSRAKARPTACYPRA